MYSPVSVQSVILFSLLSFDVRPSGVFQWGSNDQKISEGFCPEVKGIPMKVPCHSHPLCMRLKGKYLISIKILGKEREITGQDREIYP